MSFENNMTYDLFAAKSSSLDVTDRCQSFFSLLEDNFQKAGAQTNIINRFYRIGSQILCLRFAGTALFNSTTEALKCLEIEFNTQPDVIINCWDSVSTDIFMPPPPWDSSAQTIRGDIKGYNNTRFATAYVHFDVVLHTFDRETKQGFFWTHDAKKLPFYFAGSPIRPLLHWFCRLQGLHLLHAAGIGNSNGGILIAGRSGSGKSTSSLLSLVAGFDFVGDDYIAVGLSPSPTIYSLYNTAKVDKSGLVDIQHIASSIGYLGETPEHEKAMMFFEPSKSTLLKKQLPLKAILTGKVTSEAHTSISRISAVEATMALVPTTMAQIPGVYEEILSFVKQLTNLIPCYRIDFGSNLSEIPQLIGDFINGVNKS